MSTTTDITWLPVRAELPDDDTTVLIHDTLGNMAIAYHSDGAWYGADDYLYSDASVTHWAHLPEAPTL